MSDRVFLLCGCFLFGIFWGYKLSIGPWVLGLMLGISLINFRVPFRGKTLIFLALMTVLTGYLRMRVSVDSLTTPPTSIEGGVFLAQILAKKGNRLRLDLFTPEGYPLNLTSWTESLLEPLPLKPGELIQVDVREFLQSKSKGRWWTQLGVDSMERIGDPPLNFVATLRVLTHRLRLYYQGLLGGMFSETPVTRSFLLAAILRSQDGDSSQWMEGFENLGLIHIFSVSGFHISLWGLLLVLLLNLSVRSFALRLLLYVAGVLFYGLLAGFSTSVFRACLYSILLFSGGGFGRPVSPMRILSLVLIVHVFISPLTVLEPGFQLSYGMTFFILWMSARSSQRSFWLSILLIMGLQVALIPFFLYHFDQVPAFSVLGVLLSIPLSWILALGMFSLFVGPFVGAWFLPVLHLFSYPCESFLNALIPLGLSLDFALESRGPVSLLGLLCFYGGLYLIMVRFQRGAFNPGLQWLQAVDNYCTGCQDGIVSGQDLQAFVLQNAPEDPVKGRKMEGEQALESFLCLWRKKGKRRNMDFIHRGPGVGLLVLKIESKILEPIRRLGQNKVDVRALEGGMRPLIQAYFTSQAPLYYDLEKGLKILKFLVRFQEKSELRDLVRESRSQGLNWGCFQSLIKTLSMFQGRHLEPLEKSRSWLDKARTSVVSILFFRDLKQALESCEVCHPRHNPKTLRR
jgi:ComEC/Rec2-related protein